MTTAVGSKTSYSKLDKLLKKAETKRKRREDEERREEQKAEAAENRFWRSEQGKLKNKLKLAQEIFEWGRNFVKTPRYKRLVNQIGTGGGLWIGGGGWGHVAEKTSRGMWSKVVLEPTGAIRYIHGYKWCGGTEQRYVEPEGFAKELTCAYIEKLHEHVTGRGLITDLRRILNRGD